MSMKHTRNDFISVIVSFRNKLILILRQLTSRKVEWTWNATYWKLSVKAKSIIKEDACMEFYDETQPLYLETDASRVGLKAALVQTRNGRSYPRDKIPDNSIHRPIAFVSKGL